MGLQLFDANILESQLKNKKIKKLKAKKYELVR